MRLLYIYIIILIYLIVVEGLHAQPANDDCANALPLCENTFSGQTTVSATQDEMLLVLGCGFTFAVDNNVWYFVEGLVDGGTADITISGIDNDPGLKMAVFEGTCGSLIFMDCDSANGPNGTASVTITVDSGQTYYIMVDGAGGNEEGFTIEGDSPDDGIVRKPDPLISVDKNCDCTEAQIQFTNQSTEHGGDVTYEWDFDKGDGFQGTQIGPGQDTLVDFPTGNYEVRLRAFNECGVRTFSENIFSLELIGSIDTLSAKCANTPMGFISCAQMIPPVPGFVPCTQDDPDVQEYKWIFADTTFIINTGLDPPDYCDTIWHAPPSDTFDVMLITDGACGPDTLEQTYVVSPPLEVNIAPDTAYICKNDSVTFCATVDTTTGDPLFDYYWSDSSGIFDSTLASTADENCVTVGSDLAPGLYEYTVQVEDFNGCLAWDTAYLKVNPLPIVEASLISVPDTSCDNTPGFCPYDTVYFEYTIYNAASPYDVGWSPGGGLYDTLQNVAVDSITDTAFVILTTTTTFTITVTDSFGCLDDTALTITIFPPPGVVTEPLCAFDTLPQTEFCIVGACPGSVYDWALSAPHDTLLSSTTDSCVIADFEGLDAGDYAFSFEVTDGETGCVDTVSFTYTLDSSLNITLEATDTVICEEECVTFELTGDTADLSYQWYEDGNPFGTDTHKVTVCPMDTTLYRVIAWDSACSRQLEQLIIVDTLPQVAAAPLDPVCMCDTVLLDGTGSATGSDYTYSWTSTAGNTIFDPDSLITDAEGCEDDLFVLTVTNVNTGCSLDSSIALNTFDTVNVAVDSTTRDTFCVGQLTWVTLDGTGSDTGAPYIYDWTSNPPVLINNADSIIATAQIDSSTLFILTVTDTVTGCIGKDSIFFEASDFDSFNFILEATDTTICFGECTDLLVWGDSSGFSFQWYDAWNPFGSDTDRVTVCPPDTTLFSVAITDGVCTDTMLMDIMVDTLPTVAIASIDSLCRCDTMLLDGSGSSEGPEFVYNWTTSSGNTIFEPDSLITLAEICAGDVLTLTVTHTGTGCSRDAAINVALFDTITTVANTPDPSIICLGDPTVATLDGTGSDTGNNFVYNWTSIPPVTITNADSIIATAVTDSVTYFILQVTDTSTGCTAYDTTLLTTYTDSSKTISVSQSLFCAEAMPRLSDLCVLNATPGSLYDWSLSDEPGTFLNPAMDDSCETVDLQNLSPGTYTFTVEVEDTVGGCLDTLSTTITIQDSFFVEVEPEDQEMCEGETAVFTVSGADSFYWEATPADPSLSGQENDDTITVSPGVTGGTATTYTYTVSGFVAGCEKTTEVTLIVHPNPVADAGPDRAICLQENIALGGEPTASDGTVPYTYRWNPATGLSDSSLGNPDAQPPSSGVYTYLVTVEDAKRCTDSDTMTLVVETLPVINATPDTTIYRDEEVRLFAGGGVNYTWQPELPLNNPNSATPIAQPLQTTTFVVEVQTEAGCTSVDSVTINVKIPPFDIPNAFSPNGDSENDYFKVEGGEFEMFEFQIYNRWGEKVFETQDPEEGWNGRHMRNGQEQPVGNYVFYIKATVYEHDNPEPQDVVVQGNVTLLR